MIIILITLLVILVWMAIGALTVYKYFDLVFSEDELFFFRVKGYYSNYKCQAYGAYAILGAWGYLSISKTWRLIRAEKNTIKKLSFFIRTYGN